MHGLFKYMDIVFDVNNNILETVSREQPEKEPTKQVF